MSLKQISSLTLVALCLAACGGGGGGSGSRNNLNVPNGNDSSNKTPNTPDFSVPKLLKVSDFKDDLLDDIHRYTDPAAKLSSHAVKMNGKTYTSGNINLATLGNGLKNVDVVETATANINGQTHNITQTSKFRLYQQPYSVVLSMARTGGQIGNLKKIDTDDFEVTYLDGQPTKTLPTAGSFNYKGVAFNDNERGNLDYTINFDTKKGAGSISGLNQTGKITLHESDIVKVQGGKAFKNNTAFTYNTDRNDDVYGVLNGAATTEKQGKASYELGIFGPNANEVAGAVFQEHDEATIGFGGQKQ